MSEEHSDVVVVGGGVMGLATAWYAASSAHVVLVERFELGHKWGASHGGERIFRYAYTDPAYVEMAVAADDGWTRLEHDAGDQLLQRVGCLDHGDNTELEVLARIADRYGIAVEHLSAKVAGHRWPGMRFATDVLLQPSAGWVRAADTIKSLATLATERGADLRFGTQVLAIDVDGGDVHVRTATGTLVTSALVLTAGAWTTELLPGDLPLPALTTTEEHVFFFRPHIRIGGAGIPSFIHSHDRAYYGLPAVNGLVKLGEHHTGETTTGDGRTFLTEAVRSARMERYVAHWLPGLVPEVVDSTTCLYTSTPSRHFILDRLGPVVVGAGFSGHGFKFVPEIGRHLAALATGDDDPKDQFRLALSVADST